MDKSNLKKIAAEIGKKLKSTKIPKAKETYVKFKGVSCKGDYCDGGSW